MYSGSETVQEEYLIDRGFRIIVFNNTNHYQYAEEAGVNVATGMTTNIAVTRTFTYHLSAPYGNCLPNDVTQIDWTQSDVLNFMHKTLIDGNNYSVSYSQFLCVKFCYQKYVKDKCKWFVSEAFRISQEKLIVIFI